MLGAGYYYITETVLHDRDTTAKYSLMNLIIYSFMDILIK